MKKHFAILALLGGLFACAVTETSAAPIRSQEDSKVVIISSDLSAPSISFELKCRDHLVAIVPAEIAVTEPESTIREVARYYCAAASAEVEKPVHRCHGPPRGITA